MSFQLMFMMNTASGLFRTAKELQGESWELDGNTYRKGSALYQPLYEAKLLHQFDHRWATYDDNASRDVTTQEKADPSCLAIPRYWVPSEEIGNRLRKRWDRGWLLAWRDITRNTDTRTVIATVLPCVGVGHTAPLMLPASNPAQAAGLVSNLAAFVFDYAARQKVGGTHLTFGLFQQLPVLPPAIYSQPTGWSQGGTVASWLLPRVLTLTYTAWDLKPFAEDCGYHGEPFRWDEERRFQLRCDLDAAFFHLYLGTGEWKQAKGEPEAEFARLKEAFPTPRHAVEYIMHTFPLVRKSDEEQHGHYRTKQQILEVYDQLASQTQR
jgi:hypothetical protein